jgi:hypothetical protein
MVIQFNGIGERRKVLLAEMKMKCESICYDNLITHLSAEDFNLLIATNYRDYIHRKRNFFWRGLGMEEIFGIFFKIYFYKNFL